MIVFLHLYNSDKHKEILIYLLVLAKMTSACKCNLFCLSSLVYCKPRIAILNHLKFHHLVSNY